MANRNAPVGSGRNEGGIDPRAGAPKKLATPGDPHGGMHHMQGDVHVLGLSKTEATRIMQADHDLGEIHGGGIENTAPLKELQKGAPLKLHPSTPARIAADFKDNSGDVLGEAILSGSTKLPAQTSEQDCPAPVRKP